MRLRSQGRGYRTACARPGSRPKGPGCRRGLQVGNVLHIRSSMKTDAATYDLRAVRRCLVCESEQENWEPEATDEIGAPCARCHAPTERVTSLERRRSRQGTNVHAAALGRLGGLKGGPARAARLTPARRRAIAKSAARARWGRHDREPAE